MPWLTFGKYDTREDLEQAILRLYHQGDSLRAIAYKCQISTRSGHRILRKHGLSIGERSPGARPKPARLNTADFAQHLYFVRSPCWRAYCDDPRCIYHQEASRYV